MTPIDWKLVAASSLQILDLLGRQSLVTPIDWKPEHVSAGEIFCLVGRQSLVTPIDWKPIRPNALNDQRVRPVANPWCRLLVGNASDGFGAAIADIETVANPW